MASMAGLGRYSLPDQPLHVIQRGNNRGAIFFAVEDYARYHDWLAEAAGRYFCRIHAYVLMTNHVHLLVTPQHEDSLPRMMQSLGRRYVRHVNASYRRSGTLSEGPLSRRADRQRGLFPRLLPLCRAQPGARRDGRSPARLSLVELPGACRRRRRRAAQRACDLSCARARRRGAPQGLSRPVPLRARRRVRRGAEGGDQWRLGARRRALRAADRRCGRSPRGETGAGAPKQGPARRAAAIEAAVMAGNLTLTLIPHGAWLPA